MKTQDLVFKGFFVCSCTKFGAKKNQYSIQNEKLCYFILAQINAFSAAFKIKYMLDYKQTNKKQTKDSPTHTQKKTTTKTPDNNPSLETQQCVSSLKVFRKDDVWHFQNTEVTNASLNKRGIKSLSDLQLHRFLITKRLSKHSCAAHNLSKSIRCVSSYG